MQNEVASVVAIVVATLLGIGGWLFCQHFKKHKKPSIASSTKPNKGIQDDVSRAVPTFDGTEASESRTMEDSPTATAAETATQTRDLPFANEIDHVDREVDEALLDEQEDDVESPLVKVEDDMVAQEHVVIPEPEPVVEEKKEADDEAAEPVVVVAAAPKTMVQEKQETLLPKEEPEKEDQDLEEKLKTALVAPEEDEMHTLFDEIDHNGDGSLSILEVERAIFKRHASFSLKPAIVLRAYQKADANQDGSIDKDEFFQFLRMITYFKNLNQVFTLMDTNGDRQLSKDEFFSAASILDVDDPEKVWEEMDESGHGYVVFDEFCFWMSEKAATAPPQEDE